MILLLAARDNLPIGRLCKDGLLNTGFGRPTQTREIK